MITSMNVMTAVMNGVRAMDNAGYDQTWSETDDLRISCSYVWCKSHLTY